MQPSSYLDTVLAEQAARAPQVIDQGYWSTRYVFNPFHDREFSTLMQQDIGLPGLPQGEILPITRFRQMVVDNSAVLRVPVGQDGKFMPVAPGIEAFTQKERSPRLVMAAILRIFNAYASDPAQNNGICEITSLEGSDDFGLLREIKAAMLPERYNTARQQLLWLSSYVLGAAAPTRVDTVEEVMALGQEIGATVPSDIYVKVGKELAQATMASFVWARWKFRNLVAEMETPNTDKRRLSPLDSACCEWIEQPEPHFQSKLAGNPQTVVIQQAAAPVPVVPATVWCEECGTTTNLGPDGRKPKACPVCKSPFEAPVEETVEAPAKSKK